MTDRRFGLLDLILFLAVLAVAASVRIGYLATCCARATNDGIFQVQDDRKAEIEALSNGLREGRGFVYRAPLAAREEPTAHVTVGYPWLLSRLDGYWVDVNNDELRRWIQAVLGTLTAALYFLFARRAFQSVLVGTLTGILCAVHPFWIFNTAETNDGVLVTFLLGLSLFLGVRAGQSGGPLTSLLFGLTLAGLSCVRAAMFPFALGAALWFLFRCRTLPRGWLYAILAFLGFVNGLIPWTARNYQTFRAVFPIVDSTYLHLWIGNNPQATGGPMSERDMQGVLEGTLPDQDRKRLEGLERMPQPERYQQLVWNVRDELRDHPAEAFRRRLKAALGFLLSVNGLEGGPLVREGGSGEEAPEWLERLIPALLPATLFSMLFLGLLGWRWSYGWRHAAMPSSLAVMWIPLPYVLTYASTFHGPRLPLDGVFLAYTALALVCLVPGLGNPLLRGEEMERGT